MQDVFNFSAGPATMPKAVLEKAQQELLNWQNLHTSVMEISHRGEAFMKMVAEAEQNLRKLYHVPENYKILFLQGGARGQFAAIPMNLLGKNQKALYLTSGHWSKLAAQEARLFAMLDEIALLEEGKDTLQVGQLDFSDIASKYDYVHYCPNETISGVEIFDVPKVGDTVLVADMSSCILSRQIDISKFGMIYAGAQKNLGPSGITLVIIREDLLTQTEQSKIPSIWNYTVQANRDSMINTPPTFAWYLCGLVFEYWLSQGGLPAIEVQNKEKALLLYTYLDESDFYHNNVAVENRSEMNVTFTTGDSELDKRFVAEAQEHGLLALKGHKVQGGMRASIYNAMPLNGVVALVTFMEYFANTHKK